MGWIKGLEPSTLGTTIRCSNQLSYTHHIGNEPTPKECITRDDFHSHICPNGTPKGIRTPDLLLRRQLLYPTELLARIDTVNAVIADFVGAGDGNRTHAASLEGWNSTIELHPRLMPLRALPSALNVSCPKNPAVISMSAPGA